MDTLHCRCGGEVRIVRLAAKTLALGHVRNPRQNHHPVRLAPASRDARNPVPAGTGHREVPVTREVSGTSTPPGPPQGLTGPDPALVPDASRTPSAGVGHAGSPSSSQSRRRARVPRAVGTGSLPVAATSALAAGRPDNKGRVAK